MSDDLTVWLAAQIDADERTAQNARGAGSGEWRTGDHAMDECRIDDTVSGVVVFDEGAPTKVEAEHIAEHDPARVLREVEAKRRIIERCAETLSTASHYTTVESCDELDAILAEQVLRMLASVYAGRPGWREEWAA